MPNVYVIAGPNGAGKTTFARDYLPTEVGCFEFVNSDLIAAGLSPLRPEPAAVRAARIVLSVSDDSRINASTSDSRRRSPDERIPRF